MRWWLEKVKKALQTALGWVNSALDRSPREEASSLLAREIHVPTPIVTAGTALILFALLVPQVSFDPKKVLVLAGLLILLMLFFVLYFFIDLPEFVHDDEAVFLAGFCLILGVAMVELCLVVPQVSHNAIPSGFSSYAVPLGSIAIVVTLLLTIRLALLLSVVLSIFCGVLNHFSFNAMFVAFFSCSAAMLSSRKIRHRSDIMWTGFHIAWVSALCVYGLSLFHDWPAALTLRRMVWPFANGALCSVIALALLPVLEAFFSRITPITLLEVGDFNRPLLRRLMLEAPGTYHHTLLVAAIAEQAAEAIGANSLLCRVGMYYHDIGKLVHPDYFIENQTMRKSAKDKPELHDKLNPSISSLVILSHVKDGIALAHAHKVPTEVARFIPEHHGTSLIKYFYMQALEQDEEKSPPPDAFRYSGPKPRSRETVIAMLGDSVEAASRAMEDATYDRLRDMIEKIVNSKFMDGQFDNAPITLQDLRKIIDSFATSLSALYHVRIEYPELPEKEPALPLGANPPSEAG
jgi:putative nucleotidyltransferase with HDIG domain